MKNGQQPAAFPMWKIMAGRGSAFIDQFVEDSRVAIGWSEAGDYRFVPSKDALFLKFAETWPEQSRRQVEVGAGQVWRFLKELKPGDEVVAYNPDERIYHVGKVTGAPSYDPVWNERLPVYRDVKWLGTVNRDDLTIATKNTLGAIMTIFQLSENATAEIQSRLEGIPVSVSESVIDGAVLDEKVDPYDDIANIAFERAKDQILNLEWGDMQELVASLLRALGYRTIVAPRGSDRGRDIVASRDGFGFERPRIVVEVKHRKGAMGAPEIRSFLSALHQEDRGLYVSTGGFTKEAYYQAEGANNVTHLMTIDGLATALIDQYEKLDSTGRALLPLKKLYWPQ
jgi:restriction system protein